MRRIAPLLIVLSTIGALGKRASAEGPPPSPMPMPMAWRLEGVELLLPEGISLASGAILPFRRGDALLGVASATGTVLWTLADAFRGVSGSALALTTTALVLAQEGRVIAFARATGVKMWERSFPCSFMEGFLVHGETIVGRCSEGRWNDPAGHMAREMLALDIRDGRALWRERPRKGFFTYDVVDGRFTYLDFVRGEPQGQHPGDVVAIDLRSGKTYWRVRVEDAEGTLAIGEDTVVVLASGMTALSKRTGKVVWRREVRDLDLDEAIARDQRDRPLVVEDAIVLHGEAGFLRISLATGRTVEALPYPTQWSKAANFQHDAVLYLDGNRFLMRVHNPILPVSPLVFMWEEGAWKAFSGMPDAGDIAAVVEGCLVSRSGQTVSAYGLPSPRPVPKPDRPKPP